MQPNIRPDWNRPQMPPQGFPNQVPSHLQGNMPGIRPNMGPQNGSGMASGPHPAPHVNPAFFSQSGPPPQVIPPMGPNSVLPGMQMPNNSMNQNSNMYGQGGQVPVSNFMILKKKFFF